MAEVRLVDLEMIKQFSLAVRQEFAAADALLAALDADRARVLAALDAERPPVAPIESATEEKPAAAKATKKRPVAKKTQQPAVAKATKKKKKAAAKRR